MALLSAISFGLSSFCSIRQNKAHQQEELHWRKSEYTLDLQALKIDLFRSARKDVTGTFDSHIQRLDSLIFLNGLLLTFILGIVHSAGFFMPLSESCAHDPQNCITSSHKWVGTLWVYLVGLVLFTPFWSILVLLRMKDRLSSHMQDSFDDLQQLRKIIISDETPEVSYAYDMAQNSEDAVLQEQMRVVSQLSNFIVDHQDAFVEFWDTECAPQVSASTYMIWSSAGGAVSLTTFMVWIYLRHKDLMKGNSFNDLSFATIAVLGLGIPAIYLVLKRFFCCRSATRESCNERDGYFYSCRDLRRSHSNRQATPSLVSMQPLMETER